MNFLKSLLFNFLGIFFINYILPGIEVLKQSKIPALRGDLLFPLVLGFLFSVIYPILKVVDQKIDPGRIAMIAGILSFTSYAVLKFAPLGIEVKSVEGYLFAAIGVGAVGFLTNFWELKCSLKFPKPPEMSNPLNK